MASTGIPFPNIDPVLFQIGPFAICWYALAYIVGIVAGWRYAVRMVDTPRLWRGPAPATRLQIDDLLLYVTLGIILGGRIGYVLVYNFAAYIRNPLTIFEVWQGGMSFHGGATGVLIAVTLFAWVKGINPLSLADLASAVAPIGLFLGRCANFINGELWGRPTDVPWAMVFPTGGPLARHPSQLYEAALEGLVLFIVLRLLTHHFDALKRPGVVLGSFVAGYGVARTVCEFFREPDAQLGFLWEGLTMGMMLSIPMIVVGLAIVWWASARNPARA